MWQSSPTTAVIVFTISSVQMLNGHSTWGSNAAVSLPLEKTLCQWKIVESQSPLQIFLTTNKIYRTSLFIFQIHFRKFEFARGNKNNL